MDKVWWKKKSSLKSLIEVGKAIETASRICMKIENNWCIFFPWLEHIFSRCWMFSQHIYIYIYLQYLFKIFYRKFMIFLQICWHFFAEVSDELRKSNFLWLKNKIQENSKSCEKKNMLVRHRPPETPIFLGEFHEEKIAFIPLHTEKSFRNLIKSNRNQIVLTSFRLILSQTDVRLVPNQSEAGIYNLISVWFNAIWKIFLRVFHRDTRDSKSVPSPHERSSAKL